MDSLPRHAPDSKKKRSDVHCIPFSSPLRCSARLSSLLSYTSTGEASPTAWSAVLERGVDDMLTIPDTAVAPCMRLLAAQRPPIIAGESAVAGLAVRRHNTEILLVHVVESRPIGRDSNCSEIISVLCVTGGGGGSTAASLA